MIRLLTPDDWPQIESVIDTRRVFQETPIDETRHAELKHRYIHSRLNRGDVFFFGNFEGKELIAFHEAHGCSLGANFVFGASFCKPGAQRWKDSKWAKPVVELNQFAVTFLRQKKMIFLWVLGPEVPLSIGRMVEIKEFELSDPKKWKREDLLKIPANQFSGEEFIDRWVLLKKELPTSQLVMRFQLLEGRENEPPMPDYANRPKRDPITGLLDLPGGVPHPVPRARA